MKFSKVSRVGDQEMENGHKMQPGKWHTHTVPCGGVGESDLMLVPVVVVLVAAAARQPPGMIVPIPRSNLWHWQFVEIS